MIEFVNDWTCGRYERRVIPAQMFNSVLLEALFIADGAIFGVLIRQGGKLSARSCSPWTIGTAGGIFSCTCQLPILPTWLLRRLPLRQLHERSSVFMLDTHVMDLAGLESSDMPSQSSPSDTIQPPSGHSTLLLAPPILQYLVTCW